MYIEDIIGDLEAINQKLEEWDELPYNSKQNIQSKINEVIEICEDIQIDDDQDGDEDNED